MYISILFLGVGNICSESQPTRRPVKSALVGIWQKSRDLFEFEMLHGTHKSRQIVTDSIRRRKFQQKNAQQVRAEVDSWRNEDKSPKEEEKEKSFPQNLISMFFIAGSLFTSAQHCCLRDDSRSEREMKIKKRKNVVIERRIKVIFTIEAVDWGWDLIHNLLFLVFQLFSTKYCVFAYNVA